MVYIKLNNIQLNTLKKLPNNLNDSLTYHNIGGILILNKANEFKIINIQYGCCFLLNKLNTSNQ